VSILAKRPIQVFVHLAYGFGVQSWERRWKDGKILGLNEPKPYGYYRAETMGCSVTYSESSGESLAGKLLRLALRVVLGFDLVHAWRNFEAMKDADVIWTHTESQFLAILMLFRLKRNVPRPKLIAQSVWLFDHWSRFAAPRRWLYAALIRQADILTVLSPKNLAVAKRLFPKIRSELVLFGITADTKVEPVPRPVKGSLNIISLGNDVHRDWDLLIEAVASEPTWTLKIASQKVRPSAIAYAKNVEVTSLKTNDELFSLYGWADLLVLAIKPNLHASGITVLEEAALLGVPIICSDAGGLRAYFSDPEIRFVPPQDIAALKGAIRELAADPDARFALAEKAQARMGPSGLSSESYVRRHVEISRELLGLPAERSPQTET
jgi:glycosyltransferase involved in cell wall biosynthesis